MPVERWKHSVWQVMGDRHAYPTTVVRVLTTGGRSVLILLVVLALDWRLRSFHAMPCPSGCAMMMIVVSLPMAISDATSGLGDLVLLLKGGRP